MAKHWLCEVEHCTLIREQKNSQGQARRFLFSALVGTLQSEHQHREKNCRIFLHLVQKLELSLHREVRFIIVQQRTCGRGPSLDDIDTLLVTRHCPCFLCDRRLNVSPRANYEPSELRRFINEIKMHSALAVISLLSYRYRTVAL